MKIAYVHHCGSKGGAGNSLFFLLSQLKEFNYEIHVITQQGEMAQKFKEVTPNVYEIKGIPVEFTAEGFGLIRTLFVNFKSLFLRKGINEVSEIIHDIQPDLVHLNEIGMFSLAKALKTKFSFPVVMHARTVPNRRHKFIIRRFTKLANQYVDFLICITKSVANLYPQIKNKEVVYNPIHLDLKQIENTPLIDYRGSKLRVLFLANFYKQKGIQETLESSIELKDNSKIEFVVIGSNTKPNAYFRSMIGATLDILNIYPNYEKRLKSAKRDLGLENLSLLGQIDDISEEIKKCHLLIAPMHLNGTPRSVFETGVFGIPSILALYHRIDDLVEDGVNGFVIKEKNVAELTSKVLLLQADRVLLESMGKAARAKYLKHCNQRVVAEKVNSIYHKCLGH